MDVGTVFRWKDFPYPRYGDEIKPRWFIYLGKTGPFSNPVYAYLPTTTTQLHRFEPGGQCCTHSHKKFSAGTTCFDEDCIIDFDSRPYVLDHAELIDNSNIDIRGKLNDEDLKYIYAQILRSAHYSPAILRDIHTSFNNSGITGIRKPK